MISYRYDSSDLSSFETAIKQEWVMTNGLGGYAGRSLIDSQNRTHQGYLIAALHPPTERYLVFSHVSESLCHNGEEVSLKTAQYRQNGETFYINGQKYLQEMIYDGTVTYHYAGPSFDLKKQLSLKQNENTCAVYYTVKNCLNCPQTLTLTPFFNFREHNGISTPEDFIFTEKTFSHTLCLVPALDENYTIVFSFSDGTLVKRKTFFEENIELQTEVDLETEGLDAQYCPYDLKLEACGNETITLSLLCTVIPSVKVKEYLNQIEIRKDSALEICLQSRSYYENRIRNAGYQDEFADRLVLAADHFLVHRLSTEKKTILAGLPWFTDWGRDTMIAFTGIALCSGRFEEAKEILLTFAQYIKNGIVPNMFPDNNTAPLYNTADASLWYFYAVERFLHYAKSEDAYTFVKEEIYPQLCDIQSHYENGTDFSIYMDSDGLIHAGDGLDQITWMDVRVGDWVPTPRHGKPVEINALWYQALRIMEMLSSRFGEDASHYRELADKVSYSFLGKFWDEEQHCLHDIVDITDEITTDAIRPNQIYAVSLPYSMLPDDMAAAVVETVQKKLLAGCGIRSLSPEHKDYHGIYCGSLPKRDAAYHQGTAWGFLLGAFLSAYCKVNGKTEESRQEAKAEAKKMLSPVSFHLQHTGCVGSIAEIFDGDAPHTPRGCYAQAWSVGEILRAYVEDIM